MSQVHKEQLGSIQNALPNRVDPNIEIFGTEGIPEDILRQHNQRVILQFKQEEEERYALTGNPPPTNNNNQPQGPSTKKPKVVETTEELKARLAAWKAAKLAAKAENAERSNSPASMNSADPQQVFSPASNAPAPYNGSYGATPFGRTPTPLDNQGYGSGLPRPVSAQNSLSFHQPLPPLPSGLPQRPMGVVPPVSQFEMAQLHHGGQYSGQQNPQLHGYQDQSQDGPQAFNQDVEMSNAPQTQKYTMQDIDDLIADVQQHGASGTGTHGLPPMPPPSSAAPAEAAPTPPSAAPTPAPAKKSKKGRKTRNMYSNDTTTPEEFMADLPQYKFDPAERKEETVLGNVEAQVTGPDLGSEGVLDKQD